MKEFLPYPPHPPKKEKKEQASKVPDQVRSID